MSSETQSVLTKNLTLMQGKEEVTLSPDVHVLIKDRRKIILKEDLSHYGVVHLESGETTYIRNPRVNEYSGTLQYKIRKDWGDLHNIWSGTIETIITK